MAKTFQCRDAGVPCGAKISGDSEDEVLRKAIEHARDRHGVDLTRSTTLSKYVRTMIRDDSSPAGAPAGDAGAA